MSTRTLTVEYREGSGKGVARKLRAKGQIPAVLYGSGKDNIGLALNPKVLTELLATSEQGINTVIDLKIEGGKEKSAHVMTKSLQREPVTGHVIHADFYRVDDKATVVVNVRIELHGIPVGVTLDSGVLDHMRREIEVSCLPTQIPAHLDLDVSQLGVGQSLHVSDIAFPPGVKPVTALDVTVATVASTRSMIEEQPAAAAAAAAPAEAAATETKTEAKEK